MEERFRLLGPHLWTREVARPLREQIVDRLARMAPGDVLIVDATEVEVFDYSFAAELFARTILTLPQEHPGRFFAVEHLTPYARENLETTLERLDIAMVELVKGRSSLIGKSHPTDEATLASMVDAGGPVTAAELSQRLGVTVNAVNERLGKLVGLGLARRWTSTSAAGRGQFVYQTLG